MSDDVKTTAESEQLNPQPTEEDIDSDDLEYGYVVGLNKKDGRLRFELIGNQEPGAVEVMGLHQYAGFRIQQAIDGSQNSINFQILKASLTSMNLLKQMVEKMEDKTPASNE